METNIDEPLEECCNDSNYRYKDHKYQTFQDGKHKML